MPSGMGAEASLQVTAPPGPGHVPALHLAPANWQTVPDGFSPAVFSPKPLSLAVTPNLPRATPQSMHTSVKNVLRVSAFGALLGLLLPSSLLGQGCVIARGG